MKDALQKSGLAKPTPEAPKQDHKKWANELVEHDKPHVPFDAPAVTKTKDSSKKL